MTISYVRCTEDSQPDIYKAFMSGFSDYIIKFNMDYEPFVERFLGPEGNAVEHSFLAYDGEIPVGLVLGGIRDYEGLRTMRCGSLCVSPEYRRQQVAQKLFDLHLQDAVDNDCKQLFLEVIVGNDKAINFYRKAGYNEVYGLKYFTLSETERIVSKQSTLVEIAAVTLEQIKAVLPKDIHINWQNSCDYLQHSHGVLYYGVIQDDKLAAYICVSKLGRVFQLWVEPSHRHTGMGTSLVAHAVRELGLSKVVISIPNNASLEGFVRNIGFTQDPITQHEMYRTL